MQRDIPKEIQDTNTIRYVQIAVTFVAFYDHFLTFDREIEYIWQKRWTISKVLYLMNRWLGEVLLIGELLAFFHHFENFNTCYSVFYFQGYLNTFVVWLASAVMALRLTAILPQSKALRRGILAILTAELVVMMIIIYLTLHGILFTHPVSDKLMQCYAYRMPHYFYLIFLPPFVVETICFAIAFWQAMRQMNINQLWNGNELLHILVRDSIFYFAVAEILLAVSAVSSLVVYKSDAYILRGERVPWLQIPYSISVAVDNILVSRLILNLHSAYYKTPTGNYNLTLSTLDWHRSSDVETIPDSIEMTPEIVLSSSRSRQNSVRIEL